ncbi:MAG: hypothetical protein ACPGN3_10980 [Opitutales bacterium]
MDSWVIQLCALGLVFVSIGNIYRIVTTSARVKVLLPGKPSGSSTEIRPVPERRVRKPVINVDAVEIQRPDYKSLPAPEDWTFDDLYRSKKS